MVCNSNLDTARPQAQSENSLTEVIMMQRGVPLRSVDDARLADGDVTDTQGRVLYRATPLRWVWCGPSVLWLYPFGRVTRGVA